MTANSLRSALLFLLVSTVGCRTAAPAPAPADTAAAPDPLIQGLTRMVQAYPEDRAILYALASRHAQRGEKEQSFQYMARLDALKWDHAVDPKDFAVLASTSEFRELSGRISARAPQVIPEAERGRNSLFQYDLRTGALLRKVPLEATSGTHLLNDLALAANGDVFVTDSEAGSVLVLRAGSDTLTPLVPERSLIYPNGLALSEDGARLYVAQFHGLVRVDPASGQVTRVQPPTCRGRRRATWRQSRSPVRDSWPCPRTTRARDTPSG